MIYQNSFLESLAKLIDKADSRTVSKLLDICGLEGGSRESIKSFLYEDYFLVREIIEALGVLGISQVEDFECQECGWVGNTSFNEISQSTRCPSCRKTVDECGLEKEEGGEEEGILEETPDTVISPKSVKRGNTGGCKKAIADETGTNPSDWKRISKRQEQDLSVVRTFENKKDGSLIQVVVQNRVWPDGSTVDIYHVGSTVKWPAVTLGQQSSNCGACNADAYPEVPIMASVVVNEDFGCDFPGCLVIHMAPMLPDWEESPLDYPITPALRAFLSRVEEQVGLTYECGGHWSSNHEDDPDKVMAALLKAGCVENPEFSRITVEAVEA